MSCVELVLELGETSGDSSLSVSTELSGRLGEMLYDKEFNRLKSPNIKFSRKDELSCQRALDS